MSVYFADKTMKNENEKRDGKKLQPKRRTIPNERRRNDKVVPIGKKERHGGGFIKCVRFFDNIAILMGDKIYKFSLDHHYCRTIKRLNAAIIWLLMNQRPVFIFYFA